MTDKREYRVVWKRSGKDSTLRSRRFARIGEAQRFLFLFGPEPWKAYRHEADDQVCCSGYQCGCRGVTYRQQEEERREGMPELLFVRIEWRSIGEWQREEEQLMRHGLHLEDAARFVREQCA